MLGVWVGGQRVVLKCSRCSHVSDTLVSREGVGVVGCGVMHHCPHGHTWLLCAGSAAYRSSEGLSSWHTRPLALPAHSASSYRSKPRQVTGSGDSGVASAAVASSARAPPPPP